ncbi:MAG: helix-turn-helix domain-containing protein [Gammaproteobacteria bacterium]
MNGERHNPGKMEWLDLRRLIEYAAVSERTLRAWIHSPADPLPAVCVGRKILVRRSEFDAWLERHRVRALGGPDIDSLESERVNDIVREIMEDVRGH